MSENKLQLQKKIAKTMSQMKITEVPADFDARLHQALVAERDKRSQVTVVTVMPWQRIMSLAASFLLAISIGILSVEHLQNQYISPDDMPVTDDLPGSNDFPVADGGDKPNEDTAEDVVTEEDTLNGIPSHVAVDNNVLANRNQTFTDHMTPNEAPAHKEVSSIAQMSNMRSDMYDNGYVSSTDCNSLEECRVYLVDNNLDCSECMVVGYIGETSYVILSNMETILAGGDSSLDGLVGQYEIFSK
ncbi:MAG: hypothetical protein IKC38_04875 [Clostridia bacterium]|nr:hypothetical protein [Clostridia bacterium]